MHQVLDCTISDLELTKCTAHFVPENDVYYFRDAELMETFLKLGIPVYNREELHASFPGFGLVYRTLYMTWKIPEDAYVVLLQQRQLDRISDEQRLQLFRQQVALKRGHVYDERWIEAFAPPVHHIVTVENQRYYLLTTDDWQLFSEETRQQWVLKWLKEWNKDDPRGIRNFSRKHASVPYALLDVYASTFAGESGPNCFAAAIAAVVAGIGQDLEQSQTLIRHWLHQAPFFRLLSAQGYTKYTECQTTADLQSMQPADVLVWCTGEGEAGHAAFVVDDGLVFQKHGQGIEDPWQVLRIEDIWYNEYLKTDGHIAIYRRCS